MTEKRSAWFHHFGWEENPFKIRPDPEHIVGFVDIRAKLMAYVDSHDPFLIIGPTGSGKTTLLLWVKQHEDARYVYHNFLEEDSDRELRRKVKGGGFLSFLPFQLFDNRPLVVLLDEVQEMDPETARWLRGKFDEGDIQSMVMAAMDDELSNLEEPLLSRIGERRIYLRNLDEKEAFQIVRQRIFSHGDRNPFAEDALKLAFSYADYSPRKVLEACEKLCIEAASQNKDRIDYDFANMVLEPHEPTQENIKRKVASPPSGEIKKMVQDKLQRIMAGEEDAAEEEEEDEGGQELEALSPTQREIVQLLREKDMTTQEIAEEIDVSRASAAKQLSRLALNTDADLLESKGIEEPVVIQKESGRPVVYGLNDKYR